jgi:hypothetical protein
VLEDAVALCKDSSVPSEVAERVVPGLCRTAVEAALTDAVWRRQARDGLRHDDTETALLAAKTLNKLAALAITGDQGNGGAVLPKLAQWGPKFPVVYQALNKGAHDAYRGDLLQLARDTWSLARRIGSTLP